MDQSNASFGAGFFRRRRPLITRTYGKKDSKPLRLNANHFRSDPYEIPPDDEDNEDHCEPSNEPAAEVATRSFLQTTDEDGSESSGLSDEPDEASEVVRVEAEDLSQICSAGEAARRPTVLSTTGPSKKATAHSSKTIPIASARPAGSPPPAKRAKVAPKAKHNQHATTRARRRLPVNELLLVTSPIGNTNFAPPQSSPPGIQTQDPISVLADSSGEHGVSPVDSKGDRFHPKSARKQPLSAFKTRLRSSKYRYKSVDAMRKKKTTQSTASSKSSSAKGRDGFDDSELFVSPLVRKAVRSMRKKRARQDPLVPAFGALQLRSGPLPDVTFESASSTLKIESKADESQTNDGVRELQRQPMRVSFSEAEGKAMLAELSSISAPPLPQPVSDYGDMHEDEEDDGEDEHEDEDEEEHEDEEEAEGEESADERVIADGFQAVEDEAVYEADTEAGEDVQGESEGALSSEARYGNRNIEETKTPNDGVSLDFRRRAPGQRPRRRIRQDNLIEVNDNIIEIPDSEDPFTQPIQWTVTPDQASEPVAFEAPAVEEAPRPQLKRPRSILKNTSQARPASSTHAEHTAANTRRNSTIQLSESRYFNDVSDMLRNVDPAKHKTVPRRRRSSYFDDVEMLDSGAIIPETSPSPEPESEMLGYTTTGDLSVLRRNSEAEWTSQSLPGVPRDLRELTRSVSREHGTLSQSRRRKPSLPFQSPTKVR